MLSRILPAGFIEPCQPIGAAKPPLGPGWIHEIKHDGFRMMAQRRGVGGRLLTRNGNDWTDRYPSVAGAIYALKVKSCLIDGEITVCDGRGLAVFDLLRHGSQIKTEAVLFAFDLLELDGEDLRPMPIEVRKHKLAKIVRNVGSGLHLCEHLHGDGMEIFEHACNLGCEGVVSKRVGSRYVSGRTDHWIKVKKSGGAGGEAGGGGRLGQKTMASTMEGKNRIMIFCSKGDGTYIVEFRTAAGEAMAISIPRTEAAVIRYFQERMPYGLNRNIALTGFLGRAEHIGVAAGQSGDSTAMTIENAGLPLPTWRVAHRPGKRAEFLGTVEAVDREAAVAAAVEAFNLTDEQRKRLVVQEQRVKAR